MQTLSATLLSAQKDLSLSPKVKIVLTHGASSYTYEEDRILDVVRIEEGEKQTAQVLLDNSDKTLTSLDFKGYKGVISRGGVTSGGDEYSAVAELYVVAQQLQSSEAGDGYLGCHLALAGLANLMDADEADDEYTPDEDDTDTVKTLIRKIVGDSGVTFLSVYDHHTAYNIVFDSEDSLIDSYQPKDSFRVNKGDKRWTKVKELLGLTGCVDRWENDGKLHIFVPIISTSTAWQASTAYSLNDTVIPTTPNDVEYKCTTAGTSGASEPTWPTEVAETVSDGSVVWTVSFEYEYNLSSTYHTFFAKTYRKRIVIPSKVVVDSLPSQTTAYTGSAEDSDTTDLGTLFTKPDQRVLRVSSNAQCTSLATAILSHYQRDAEQGHGFVPMNVGAEIYDFVKVTDSRENDYRVGNIGYIREHYRPGRGNRQGVYEMEFRFGKLTLAGLLGTIPPSGLSPSGGLPNLQALWDYLLALEAQLQDLIEDVQIINNWLLLLNRFFFWTSIGDVIIRPELNRMLLLYGDFSMVCDQVFGLMMATAADCRLFWSDSIGTRDHTFAPETDGHGKIGDATYTFLEGHFKKGYFPTELYIPAEA